MPRQYHTFFASAQRAATVSSAVHDMDGYNTASFFLDVTAIEGTNPTLDVVIEDSPDGTRFFTHTAMTQVTGTSAVKRVSRISNFGRYVRATATLGGTNTPKHTYQLDMCKDVQ